MLQIRLALSLPCKMLNTDRVALNVSINGIEIPPDQITLQGLNIVSNWQQYLPAGELVFNDPTGVFASKFNIEDGAPVSISVGMSLQSSKTYNFRVLKPGVDTVATGTKIRLILYWDNPTYWAQTTSLSIKGPSSAAVNAIGNACGFSSIQVDPTNDIQVWIPGSSRYCKFAAETATAGWVNDKSLLLLGVTLGDAIRYKNVGANDYSTAVPIKLGQLTNTSGYIPACSWQQRSIGGFKNFQGAYHEVRQHQSILAPNGVMETLSMVHHQRMTQYLNMNKDVKQLLNAGRKIDYSIIDCGNVHAKYNQAIYQNGRMQQLLSNMVDIVTLVQTDLDLFDPLTLSVLRPTTDANLPTETTDVDGNYFIIGKTIHVGPEAIYCEKFNTVRDGHNISTGQSV